MASRKENLKSLFSNTRTRVIIIFTLVLMIITIVIGYMKLRGSTQGVLESSQIVQGPTGIQSIPGVQEQTAQYAKLQQQQNINQALQAEKSGASAIPTIIRTQALGEGVGVIGAKDGHSGIGFTALNRDGEGTQSSLWIQSLKEGSCSKTVVTKVVSEGAQLNDLKQACTCVQLKDTGYALQELNQICACKELKAAGYSARQLKDIGYTADRLKDCGFNACELRAAGFTAQQMKTAGFSDGELKGAGFSGEEIDAAGGLPNGISAADVRNAGCSVAALNKLRTQGVSVSAIRRLSGCSIDQLKAAGFSAKELKNAGFTAAELRRAGFSADQLKSAGFTAKELKDAGFTAAELSKAGFSAQDLKAVGFTPRDLLDAGFTPAELSKIGFTEAQIKAAQAQPKQSALLADARLTDCSVAALKKSKASGVSAQVIRETLGCSLQALKDAGYNAKELKDAGFTAAELKTAGFGPKDLLTAGFTAKELRDAGFSAGQLKAAGLSIQDLKEAGFTAAELKGAGFSPKDLLNAGFTAKELRDAGFTAGQLKAAGLSAKDLKGAGFNEVELKSAGFTASQLSEAGFAEQSSAVAQLENPDLPNSGTSSIEGGGVTKGTQKPTLLSSSNDQLQAILKKQNQQMAEQKYQQKIQQRTSEMLQAANQSLQGWKQVNTQVYTEGTVEEKTATEKANETTGTALSSTESIDVGAGPSRGAALKAGDIVFAVMDTSVNSDEPGPILATIVSGKLKGTKLIGSFNLPANAEKMVISFNTISVPGVTKTISVSAVAIDPNTARTALSSRTDHHFLMRYGSLFASAFLQGFGNAFQSANTTVTVGGTGGGNNITVQNGIGRSALENAVIGLAQVGQNWSQQAQQLFNTPTTVQVYSGTGIGVLFTQDVLII